MSAGGGVTDLNTYRASWGSEAGDLGADPRVTRDAVHGDRALFDAADALEACGLETLAKRTRTIKSELRRAVRASLRGDP